jgi:hypothetical protein
MARRGRVGPSFPATQSRRSADRREGHSYTSQGQMAQMVERKSVIQNTFAIPSSRLYQPDPAPGFRPGFVRFAPNSRHRRPDQPCPKSANSGNEHLHQTELCSAEPLRPSLARNSVWGCQKPRDECRWQAGRSIYGISYTTSSFAIPRSDARCRTGSRLLLLRIDEEPGCSTTGPVAKIEREAARP